MRLSWANMKNFILFWVMGFRENPKEQLDFIGMYVKELAVLLEVKKQTIDSYLKANSCMPSADATVAIAKALACRWSIWLSERKSKEKRFNIPMMPEQRRN